MQKSLILFIWVLLVSTGYSQTSFYRLFGGDQFDYGYDIVEMPDSGFLITGMSGSFNEGHADAFLLRLDKWGNYLWSSPYGGSENDASFDLEYKENFGTYMTGRKATSTGDFDFWLSLIDDSGNVLWERVYPGSDWEEGVEASLTLDSGLVVAVHRFGNNTQDQDVSLMRLDSWGDTVWVHEYSHPGYDEVTNIESYQDSLFVISSNHLDSTTNLSIGHIQVIHENGMELWRDSVDVGTGSTYLNDFFISNDSLFAIGTFKLDDTSTFNTLSYVHYLPFGYGGEISSGYSVSQGNFIGDAVAPIIGSQFNHSAFRFNDPIVATTYDFYIGLNSIYLVPIGTAGYTITDGEDQIFKAIPTADSGAVFVGYQSMGAGGSAIAVVKVGTDFDYPNINGVTFVNQLVSTNELLSMKHIVIYPNPSSSIVKIETPKGNASDYKISSLKGDMIKEGKIQGLGTTISVQGIEDGMYLLQLYQNENFLGAERLLIR